MCIDDFYRLSSRQRPLGLLSLSQEPVSPGRVFTRINPVMSILEMLSDMINDSTVPIDSSEVHVPRGCNCSIRVPFDLHQGYVECTTAQIVDQDHLCLFGLSLGCQEATLNTIRDGSRGRFVDDIDDFETGELTCILSRLATRFVKESRDSDNRFSDDP